MRYGIRVGWLCCFVVAMVGAGRIAQAGSAIDLLYEDGTTITQLEDNDWESFSDDGDGNVEVGEVLFGMFEIADVRDAFPDVQGVRPRQADMFAGVFVLEIASVDTENALFNGGVKVTLKPAPAVTWTDLGLAAPVSPNTMAVVYSDPDGPQNMVDPSALGGINASLATATNGTKLWEVGFAGGGSDPTEFWEADANSISFPSLSALMYSASLNVTHAEASVAGVSLLKHDFLFQGGDGVGGIQGTFSQVQLEGGMESHSAGNFQIRTDVDLFVKAVPEPATITYLLLAGASLLITAVMRRKR